MFTYSLFAVEKSIRFQTQEQWNVQIAELRDQADQIDKITMYKVLENEIDYSSLSAFPKLKELVFLDGLNAGLEPWSSLFNDQNIHEFPALPSLEKIKIHAFITSDFLPVYFEWLAQFENLKEIDLSENYGLFRNTGEEPLPYSLSALSRLDHLEKLNLSSTIDLTFQSKDALEGLADIKTLKTLIYSRNNFNSVSHRAKDEIRFILSLDFLEEVDLSWAGVLLSTSAYYAYNRIDLKDLFSDIRPGLKKLVLNYANFESFNFGEFVPNLEWLEIAQKDYSPFDLRELGGFKKLKYLNMYFSHFTQDNLWELQSLTPFEYLEELNLEGAAVKGIDFSFAPYLKKLNLSGSTVGNGDISALRLLTHLESLDLSSSRVTGAGLKNIAKLTGLKTLRLAALNLSTASFEKLNLLENLDLSDATLNLDGLLSLNNLKNLKTLNLKNIHSKHIKEKDIQDLKNSLPNCTISY